MKAGARHQRRGLNAGEWNPLAVDEISERFVRWRLKMAVVSPQAALVQVITATVVLWGRCIPRNSQRRAWSPLRVGHYGLVKVQAGYWNQTSTET
jgi:hypothetical protein